MPRQHSVAIAPALGLIAAIALLFIAGPARASGVDPTKISIPNGPASIEGLGRNFVPSLASGTATYGVDIAVPPAAAGFAPHLSLEYDAGGGVSELGMGFRLGGLPSIRRRTENGLPKFDASDAFEITGIGMPSDLLLMPDGFYRPEHETGSFVRVEQSPDGTSWEARAKGGVTFRFGGEGFTEEENGKVATYLLREQADLHGHFIEYAYDTSEGHALIDKVTWNDFGDSVRQELVFSYEARPDVHELFSSGIRQVLSKRLTHIDVTLGGELVRRYTLSYAPGTASQLTAVDMVGTDRALALPRLSLDYTQPSYATAGQVVAMKSPPGRSPADPDVALADLNGDGLPDLLVTQAGQYRSYVNHDGVTWNAPEDWTTTDSPSVALSTTGVQLADLDGDAAVDLVIKSGIDSFRYLPGKDATHFGAAVTIATVPNFTFEDPDVRLADMDGDRRTDVAITTSAGLAIGYNLNGSDWSVPATIGIVDPQQPLRFSDGKTQLCDVNGDRIQDFCYLYSGSLAYWLGRGRGAFQPAKQAQGVPQFDETDPWKLIDLNGDGWVDLVHVGVNQVSFALATSAGVFAAPRVIDGTPTKTSSTAVEFADMNGSCTVDIVWVDVAASPDTAWRYLELFPDGRAGLLSKIDNGLGKVTRIYYEPAALSAAKARDSGKPWTTRMNVAMPVVDHIEVDSSLGDPLMVTRFDYSNGTWDPKERTFAGFAGGLQTEVGDEFTPTLLTENTFDAGLVTRVLRGAILTSERRDETGYLFSRSTSTYTPTTLDTAVDGRAIQYAYKSSERTDVVEGTDATTARTTLSEWVEDSFGNTTEERHWGEVVGTDKLAGNDEAITIRSFANNTADWILGYLATEELQDAQGKRFALKRNYYDGAPFQGLALGQVARGDLTRQEEWLGPELDKFALDFATKYNSDGQPVETSDARGGGRLYTWDAEDHTSIKSEQVKLDSNVELIERAEVDRRFGEVLSVTEYNGQRTHFAYDALGRLTTVFKPGDPDDQPSVNYTYAAASPLSRVITESRVWPGRDEFEHSETVFDGLGRKRAALTRAENEQWVLAGVSLFDARGQARRALRPRFISADQTAAPPLFDDAAGTSSWRDAAAREVRTLSQGGIATRTEHAPFEKRTWDGGQTDSSTPYEHLPTVSQSDGLGRIIAASQYLEGKLVSARFSYDPAGRLLSKTDPEGNTSTYQYDGRGDRVVVDDPDLGRRAFVFDETGNLTERHNPDGNVLKYTFDLAGRSLTEDWDGDGDPEVTRHWDVKSGAADDLLYRGKLVSVDDPTGGAEHEYDKRGRVSWTHVTIDGHRYSSGSLYDNLDREYLHIYPDKSSIRIHRNSRGQLSGYGDAVQLFFDGDGVETERHFNTGVVQKYGYDLDRRLDELVATAADGSPIENLEWDFDPAGNLRSIADLRPSVSPADDRSETYTYDNLYRLRTAQGSWGHSEWSYSLSGNLVSRTSSVASQNAGSIAYGENSGPHAPTTFGTRKIVYDNLGRMSSDGDRTYTWNGADQLTSVTASSGASEQNKFDADGTRRVRIEKDSNGAMHTTRFISPWTEVQDGKLVRYIVHTERRIARLSSNNGVPKKSFFSRLHNGDPRPLVIAVLSRFAELALTMVLLFALAWTERRRISRALAIAAAACALLVIAGCSGDSSNKSPNEEGTVKTLSDADTLLFTDPLGSLLSETTGSGAPKAHFAAYPYGATRYDTSAETRHYANAPRDAGVGLDLMGARFYAADLGVWTLGDPILINAPSKAVNADFGAVNAYAYANLNPVVTGDRDGNFPQILIGIAVGAAAEAAIEAARQLYTSGRIESWGRIGAAAASGAVSGAIVTAFPAVGLASVMGIGALSGAAGGMTARLISTGGKSAGTLGEIAVDASIGAVTAGALKGAGKLLKRTPPVKPPAQAPKVAAGEWGDVGDPLEGVMDRWQAEAFCRTGGCKVPAAGAATRAAEGATAPVGRLGSPMTVPRGTNAPAVINGRQFTGHALDQMQGRGLTPSVVEDTIARGTRSAGREGATIFQTDQARVILNPNGSVKTVMPFSP